MKSSLPGQTINANQVPQVFVSLVPAELILLRGEPTYLAVQGATPLLWVSNTDSDVFRMGRDRAPSTSWSPAGGSRHATSPGPGRSPRRTCRRSSSRFRSSTSARACSRRCRAREQAAEAVLLAQIPQTARVSKTAAGARSRLSRARREFQPIEKTTVQRAVNTDKDIIKVGDLYYMCFQGVWFMSKAPTGPWQVTGEVPKQIYEIPVSSPSHSVTYVTVEDDDDDEVLFATAMAFTGVMVAWGCAVWGTGYYYPPYCGYGGYPYYYPYYPTYGYRRVLQPVDRRLHARRGGLRSLRRRRRRPALQPENRHLLAWRRRPRPVRLARRRVGLQPAHRHVRRDPAGLERVRELGHDRRPARRRLGEPRRGTPTTSPATRRASRGRATATSTPAVTATSTARTATACRSTTTAAGTTCRRRPSSASRRRIGRRSPARRRATARPRRDGFGHAQPDRPRFRGARRGRAAHARLGPDAEREQRHSSRSGSYRPSGGGRPAGGGGGRRR